MIGKVNDNTFIDTMSEYLCNTYFSNFENYAHTYQSQNEQIYCLGMLGHQILSRK
jgi:hypothetical protein